MGIFTDLAIGGITQFDETARRDTERNIATSNIALNKETEAFKTTELAYKNFDQVKNIVSNNLEAFNIKPQGNFSNDQFSNFPCWRMLGGCAGQNRGSRGTVS